MHWRSCAPPWPSWAMNRRARRNLRDQDNQNDKTDWRIGSMASNCEDVTAHMMELLYGELPADARASVDAHVAGCARCRAELDGFEKTRALARTGLDEAPPARARAAIMQAASAHLAAAQAQARPVGARRPAAAEKESFWERLRARWTFPTLATVGAVAVFMVANRVFLNPERTLAPRPAPESPAVSSTREPASVDLPEWRGEPPEPKAERPGAGSDQAGRPRADGSRAHHAKGGDARREIAERAAIQGGGRADEK